MLQLTGTLPDYKQEKGKPNKRNNNNNNKNEIGYQISPTANKIGCRGKLATSKNTHQAFAYF